MSSFTSAGASPHFLTGYTIVGMMLPPRPRTPDTIESIMDSVMKSPRESPDSISGDSVMIAVPINAWEFNAMRLANDPVFLARQRFADLPVGPAQRWWRDMFKFVVFHHLQGPMVLCYNETEQEAFELGRCDASMSFTWDLPVGHEFS
ncbi:hypothetical protein N7486_009174 [Penicillium sp. IBT 16267x]|nr:hypothetical protein N7486_009174 [Penicillium sp. IBT 16267x]